MRNEAFGQDRIYYNNFAAHLLNAYNPNMLYPRLPYRWTDADWRACIDMIAGFGYTHFEFWLVPRLFCRDGINADFGREFVRQVNVVIDYAHRRGIKVIALCSLATVGSDWHTCCPNLIDEWAELKYLWGRWVELLLELDGISIFPGDPGACSRNGCTAETYIDKSIEIAHLVKRRLPQAEIEFGTWGPPFFGWGNIRGPEGWQGEFVQDYQHTAWTFDEARMERSMQHLLRRLSDFPDPTVIAINLGFNPDGNPDGAQSAIPWANEIARSHAIRTWDFSLTEGENNVVPHYRFARLFAQRQRERQAAPYRGGICFTMTPALNQLSLWEAAQSFVDPDADSDQLAADFYERLYGPDGRRIPGYLPLFEVVKDWGNYVEIDCSRASYHRRMRECVDLLEALAGATGTSVPLHPSSDAYRRELLFFARLFADLSAPAPDFDALAQRYWNRVYAIYDQLPQHVDPRPQAATTRLINHFGGSPDTESPIARK